jgi:NTP pyrophosphatase (non-canonical NTP hydrolase)
MKTLEQLKPLIIEWANEKYLIKKENYLKQYCKMVSEVGELGDALIKNDNLEIIDAIGDVQVCLIILCEQLELDVTKCLESAYNVIKDRKGITKNGTFIKD